MEPNIFVGFRFTPPNLQVLGRRYCLLLMPPLSMIKSGQSQRDCPDKERYTEKRIAKFNYDSLSILAIACSICSASLVLPCSFNKSRASLRESIASSARLSMYRAIPN